MEYVRKNGLKRVLMAAIAVGFSVLPAVVFLVPNPAVGTDELMKTLPAYERFRCALCHATAAPTPEDHPLNVFGRDFLANGNLWSETLALMNSDGDRCANGTEIGDRDGDGVHDDGGDNPREISNPGNSSDCTAPIDEATWGLIKEIFNNEFDLFVLQEPEYEYFALYFGS